jgi:ribosome maturation factor RimP
LFESESLVLVQEQMAAIELIAEEIAKNEGCKLYDLEFVGSGQTRVLRVYIDKESQNIDIDDCVNVSKALNLRLDEEDIIPGGAYQLEVSSPGVDRHLKKDWHFQKAIGQKIHIKLNQSLGDLGLDDKRWVKCRQTDVLLKNYKGSALSVELQNGVEVLLPLSIVDKAKVIFEVQKNNKNNHNNPKNKR